MTSYTGVYRRKEELSEQKISMESSQKIKIVISFRERTLWSQKMSKDGEERGICGIKRMHCISTRRVYFNFQQECGCFPQRKDWKSVPSEICSILSGWILSWDMRGRQLIWKDITYIPMSWLWCMDFFGRFLCKFYSSVSQFV